MKIAIYLRVSTKDQSMDLQQNELLAFCKQKGWEDINIYKDHGVSGGSVKRDGLSQLMEDAKNNKIDILLVWKIDRLFRSLKHLILTIEELEKNNVKFISIKDSLDFTTSAGRLMFQMVGAFAEFERNMIRERVTAGMKAAKKRGSKIGRPITRNNNKIISLRDAGLSIRAIAKEIGTSIGAVQRALA